MTHLWEVDHPFYCTEGNFYARPDEGLHTEYGSWTEFYESWGDSDEDMNFVFRWDWKVPDPDDYEPGATLPPQRLFVYWVLQRKAILRSTECVVTPDDEPAVRGWLTKRALAMAATWAPLLGEPIPDGEER